MTVERSINNQLHPQERKGCGNNRIIQLIVGIANRIDLSDPRTPEERKRDFEEGADVISYTGFFH